MGRAPEVKTLRRKLGELVAYRRGAALQGALAAAHAATGSPGHAPTASTTVDT
ncbi:hypothetical protein [Candidatus Mycobacterium methanotrophicum]|uniref:Uncharacterized protein n=1 Tax=Candidatus Mycobacterium methanotrophicum TaxID=2943498 RepID=A0ABY4QHH2_9MYCO|nr:hypothetical protein [Candidatus Mycobacterium methanotrophicum]UQX09986.1 hypothetical protein M5I08_17385 [Candidatus Mycobacterium methanotrophicum]